MAWGSARVEGSTVCCGRRKVSSAHRTVFNPRTGVAILVPENQGTTCCLPRKLAFLEDPRMKRKKRSPVALKEASRVCENAKLAARRHRHACRRSHYVTSWQKPFLGKRAGHSACPPNLDSKMGSVVKKNVIWLLFWIPNFGPQTEADPTLFSGGSSIPDVPKHLGRNRQLL